MCQHGSERRFARAWANSLVVAQAVATLDRLERACANWKTFKLLKRGRPIVTGSWLFRWLLGDPSESTVVEVDDSRLLSPPLGRMWRFLPTLVAARRRLSSWRFWRAGTRTLRQQPTLGLIVLGASVFAAGAGTTTDRAGSIGLGICAIVLGVVVLGLRDERVVNGLSRSRTVSVLSALVAPPETEGQR